MTCHFCRIYLINSDLEKNNGCADRLKKGGTMMIFPDGISLVSVKAFKFLRGVTLIAFLARCH